MDTDESTSVNPSDSEAVVNLQETTDNPIAEKIPDETTKLNEPVQGTEISESDSAGKINTTADNVDTNEADTTVKDSSTSRLDSNDVSNSDTPSSQNSELAEENAPLVVNSPDAVPEDPKVSISTNKVDETQEIEEADVVTGSDDNEPAAEEVPESVCEESRVQESSEAVEKCVEKSDTDISEVSKDSATTPDSSKSPVDSDAIVPENSSSSEAATATEAPETPTTSMEVDAEEEESGKTAEPENTEFVQMAQDKPDDSPIEGQSMEAEDPFGGDNLALADEGDSVQDDELVTDVPKETSDVSNDSEKADENTETTEKTPAVTEVAKPPSPSKTIVVEVTDDQSTILPGQDDELCIIPDSMKTVNLPASTSEVATSTEKNNTPEAEVEAPESVATVTEESSNIPAAAPVRVQVTKEPLPVIDLEDDARSTEIEEISSQETCRQCKAKKICKIKVKLHEETFNVCSDACQSSFMEENSHRTEIPSDSSSSKYEKRCANCLLLIEESEERNLSWETMEFCNEECLGKFQKKYGSYCRNCNGSVAGISLGKYCIRFGYDVKQFCAATCLEEFKKGLKLCSYCQKDISSGSDGFLAPVGDKGQFKDFCTQFCMEKYSKMNSTEPPTTEIKACSVCQEKKVVFCEVTVDRAPSVAICSEPCFAAFKFVNKVDPDQCSTCKKYFELVNKKNSVVFYNGEANTFCNKTCLNIFIITHRQIVPCNWCKVKKYNFDMIRKDLKSGQIIMMCSLNCLALYQVSVSAVSSKRINCDFCKDFTQAQYHLTMSDATIRNFCNYECVMKFQSQYTKSPITIPAGEDTAPVPTGIPKRATPGKLQTQATKKAVDMQNYSAIGARSTLQPIAAKKNMPVISSVTSLASNGQTVAIAAKPTSTMTVAVNNSSITNTSVPNSQSQVFYKQQVIIRPPSPVRIHNKMTQCKPLTHTKGVSVKPHPCNKSTQTDDEPKVVVPIPVPIYVPFPVHMWSFPYPVPMPFPLPIPVPIFVPTTRNSAKGIFKEIKRIQEKIPSDPYEAELLMMAEMAETDQKPTDSDSDSDGPAPEPAESNNSFGDEMLQIALTTATEQIEESAVDLEAALTPNTITAPAPSTEETEAESPPERTIARAKKRIVTSKRSGPLKRGRRTSATAEPPLMPPPEPAATPQIVEPVEKPDANMALKYTFGVNAWRKWVVAKNAELEKDVTGRKVKPFKTDLLQLTADELNYTLCLFVKEVRKPNGAEYAPDTIYYLCLGIQQYLFENNRIDNIFTDTYYEQFTDCLNDVAKKFSVLYNDAHYIVTRVEEEHLWECKQLGAHSPHVLLSTLMFFNTKHFNLVTVEEHMQLSFSHIMKHWKRNPAAQPTAVANKTPSSRNVLLRFYPPQAAIEANSKKKKVYEQQENEDNPLRCPVKLYEFYLSKCPESVKTRNDVFYLLPERSCVPDSPVWYSTSALAKEHLVKMLNRVKMVKEINVALLNT